LDKTGPVGTAENFFFGILVEHFNHGPLDGIVPGYTFCRHQQRSFAYKNCHQFTPADYRRYFNRQPVEGIALAYGPFYPHANEFGRIEAGVPQVDDVELSEVDVRVMNYCTAPQVGSGNRHRGNGRKLDPDGNIFFNLGVYPENNRESVAGQD
jgi:hypothetical protein